MFLKSEKNVKYVFSNTDYIVFHKIGTTLYSFQMLVNFNENYITVFAANFPYRYNVLLTESQDLENATIRVGCTR